MADGPVPVAVDVEAEEQLLAALEQMPWDASAFAFAGDSAQGVDRKTTCCGGDRETATPAE